MLEMIKEDVLAANLLLPKYNLVTFTWGNVSAIDRNSGLVVIKPSGISYENMKAEDMVVVDLEGNVIEGKLKPSSDTKTHIELYKAFPQIGGIVHTHSPYATSWAQACRDIPCYGTTHADYFCGSVPCARSLTKHEVDEDYEKNTGKVIIETIVNRDLDYIAIPAILCANHGPFTWGKSAEEAVYHAVVLEEVAKMATLSESHAPNLTAVPDYILDKHYQRKHGKNAYYGQT